MSKDYVMQLEETIQNLIRYNAILKKLNAKYKDLEEQIGCPLDVVFKLLNQDYYYDELGHIWHLEFINLKNGATQFGAKGNVPQDLKNYKKTFWLKKDKSE